MSEYRVPILSTADGITGDTAVVGGRGGVAYDVTYNATAAANWASAHCDRGDGRRFGPCETDGGVTMQERAGEAVLLAVAFNVRVVGPDGETDLTVVVEVTG